MSKANIQEDEALANAVQKYSCLYDKSNKGYKEADRKKNAWREIEAELGLEAGTAEKSFDLLKKRHSRRKNDLKRSNVSGAGTNDVSKPKKMMDEYSFMGWLQPYIRFRKTTHNLASPSSSNDAEETQFSEISKLDEDTESSEDSDVPSKVSESAKKTTIKVKPKKDDVVKETEVDVMKGMHSLISKRLEKASLPKKNKTLSGDEIFAQMIAHELSQFPEEYKFIVKHDINDVLYKHQVLRKQKQEQQRYQQQQQPFYDSHQQKMGSAQYYGAYQPQQQQYQLQQQQYQEEQQQNVEKYSPPMSPTIPPIVTTAGNSTCENQNIITGYNYEL